MWLLYQPMHPHEEAVAAARSHSDTSKAMNAEELKKNIGQLFLICLLIALAGCAQKKTTFWVGPGNASQANYDCLREAQQPYARSGGGGNATYSYTQGASTGMATNYNLFSACMHARGFRLVTSDSAVPPGDPALAADSRTCVGAEQSKKARDPGYQISSDAVRRCLQEKGWAYWVDNGKVYWTRVR
jgi:hypothetical protein